MLYVSSIYNMYTLVCSRLESQAHRFIDYLIDYFTNRLIGDSDEPSLQ